MGRVTTLVTLLLCVTTAAFAQQRIVVEKATGNVVDVGDTTLQYDSRFFDHIDSPQSVIPAGEDLRKYTRNAAGAIQLRPKDELVKNFADEWRNDLIARINSIRLSEDIKSLLIEIVKGVQR
jgi:hypothetical protein